MLLISKRQEQKAVRSKTVLDIREMIRMMRLGMSNSEIVRMQEVNWRTVARYRTVAEAKGWLEGELPSNEVINQAIKRGRGEEPRQNLSTVAALDGPVRAMRARGMEVTVLYQRLSADYGFKGQYGAVYRYVRKIEQRTPEVQYELKQPSGKKRRRILDTLG